ncbi:MAG: hypothetical protein ACFCVC_05540 [Acidimicrobiia bacterium]
MLERIASEYPPIPIIICENGVALPDEVGDDGSVDDGNASGSSKTTSRRWPPPSTGASTWGLHGVVAARQSRVGPWLLQEVRSGEG